MQRSLARQVTGRLALAISASLLATVTVSAWLANESRETAKREQLRDARDHFAHRIPEWEGTWESNALGMKARLEYTRLLETRTNRAERRSGAPPARSRSGARARSPARRSR